MKSSLAAIIASVLVVTVSTAGASSNLVITSFQGNGQLTYTPHPFGTNHWVEWAPSASGRWTNSWNALLDLAPTGRTHTVSVPMFYRVVCQTASNELQVTIAVDNRYWMYITTNDNETGTFLASKINDAFDYTSTVLTPVALVPGITNYLHVVAEDVGIIAGLLAQAWLNTSAFRFGNGENFILSGASGWQVSRTGFGQDYESPAEIVLNRQELWVLDETWAEIPGVSRDAIWIWTGNQFDINVTRYFTLPIIPVP